MGVAGAAGVAGSAYLIQHALASLRSVPTIETVRVVPPRVNLPSSSSWSMAQQSFDIVKKIVKDACFGRTSRGVIQLAAATAIAAALVYVVKVLRRRSHTAADARAVKQIGLLVRAVNFFKRALGIPIYIPESMEELAKANPRNSLDQLAKDTDVALATLKGLMKNDHALHDSTGSAPQACMKKPKSTTPSARAKTPSARAKTPSAARRKTPAAGARRKTPAAGARRKSMSAKRKSPPKRRFRSA